MVGTTASYKLRNGVAKTLEDNLHDIMKSTTFSLNLDESTSENKHKVLSILVAYFSQENLQIQVSIDIQMEF